MRASLRHPGWSKLFLIAFGVSVVASVSGFGGVAHAACTDCTFDGTGAGTGANGMGNSAFGVDALTSGNTGDFNTAEGLNALFANTSGHSNTANGIDALEGNIDGNFNTADGESTLFHNTSGFDNTAIGAGALLKNTIGNGNVSLGANAGGELTTGSANVDIANDGVAGESSTIRIGTEGTHLATFIAGINSASMSPKTSRPMYIDSKGQIGVKATHSSARYKRDVADMADASSGLLALRPVTFHYKDGPDTGLEYGLIAEEVAKLYPEIVTHDDNGRIEGVLYEELPAMLLNEVQKLARENQRLVREVEELKKRDAQVDALVDRINTLELQTRGSKAARLAAAMK